MSKRFQVSVMCECFATVEVTAKDKKEAEKLAMAAHYKEREVQEYTLIPRVVESVEEIIES